MKAVGLCHSDLSLINRTSASPLPMVLGHEGAGIVTGAGGAIFGGDYYYGSWKLNDTIEVE